MTGNRCLLDTSVIIHFFKNIDPIVRAIKSFEEIYVSSIVVGELYYGAYASSNPPKHTRQIESFLNNCTILQTDINTPIIYGQLKSDVKKKGTPLPENDIWIAAIAIENKIPLLTADKHFNMMELDLIPL